MREIHDQYWDGSGEHSAKQMARIKERLNKAFSTLSGIQQPPRPCDPEDSFALYEKEVKEGKKEIRDIAEDIFYALTGREVKSTRKATRN
jgi:hypothetical protein